MKMEEKFRVAKQVLEMIIEAYEFGGRLLCPVPEFGEEERCGGETTVLRHLVARATHLQEIGHHAYCLASLCQAHEFNLVRKDDPRRIALETIATAYWRNWGSFLRLDWAEMLKGIAPFHRR